MRPPNEDLKNNGTPEPWALLYEAVVAYVMKHREEYGHDIADNPMVCRGVASILRGLEVLLDGEVGNLEPGRCWDNLDNFARFAGWSEGLEGAAGLDDVRDASVLQRDALRLFEEMDETSPDLSSWARLESISTQAEGGDEEDEEDSEGESERDTQSIPLFSAAANFSRKTTSGSHFLPVAPARSRVARAKPTDLPSHAEPTQDSESEQPARTPAAAHGG